MDIITYAKSKTYTNETAEEFGGLKGANCTIKSITPITGGNTVTFEWKNSEGATQEGTLDVMDGVNGNDGLGIKSVTINASNHLIITYDDDTTEDAGEVQTVQGEDGKSAYEIAVEHGYSGTEEEWLASLKGEDGEEGFSPEITVKESTSERYVLTIKTKDDEFDTPNLKGGGSGSASRMSDLEDVQLTSLTTGQILKWNGSKWVNEDGVEIDSLGDINDVDLGTLTDGQVLSWDATNQKWVNKDAVNPTQFATMPSPASALSGIVYQYVGGSSQAFVKGHFYTCLYDNENDTWYWSEIKYAADTDSALDPTSKNPVANDALCEEFDKKQDKDLETPIEVDGAEQTTVEDTLLALNTYAAKKVDQLNSLPVASADTLGMLVQYKGATTATLKHAFFYECKVVEGSDPAEYEWVDAGIGGEDLSQYKKIFSGTSAEWDALPLEDKITYDYIMPDDDGETGDIADVVESGNHNPVESDAVFDSEQTIYEVMGQMGAKNLIPYPHDAKTETKAGITFTENADGSITINGTATDIARHLISSQQFEVGKKYILSGCPSGGGHGSNGTYTLYTQTINNYDDGEGVEFTWNASITGITIAVYTGVTVDNLTFYPMLRLASDTDSTYEPYAKTNQQLTKDKAEQAEVNDMVNVLGAKNLLPYPYDNSTVTKNNVSFTDNGDGTITISTLGDRSSNTFFNLSTGLNFGASNWSLNGSSEKEKNIGSFIVSNGFDEFFSGLNFGYTVSNMQTWIVVSPSAELNNVTIKPMIRLASITDNTYQPYAKTNKELTGDIDSVDAEIVDIVNVYGSKNLLPFDIGNIKAINTNGTWSGNSYTYLGITYTLVLNDDGTLAYVEANGTANTNAQAQFHFMRNSLGKKVYMPEGHILMSGCPSGGSDSSFSQVLYYDGAWYVDIGLSSGKDITITDPTKAVDFYINIKNGTTVDHQRYYPMIRLASIADDTYAPYAKTNQQLTKETTGLIDNENILGAKNFLKQVFDYVSIPNVEDIGDRASSANGLSFTYNDDGSITVNGTPTDSTLRVEIKLDWKTNSYKNNDISAIAGKDVIGSIVPTAVDGIQMRLGYFEAGGTGHQSDAITTSLKYSLPQNAKYLRTYISISGAYSYNNVTLYPMVRLASDPDDTYVPYAMTNQELTDELKVTSYNVTNSEYNVRVFLSKYGKVVAGTINSNSLSKALSANTWVTMDSNIPNCTDGVQATSITFGDKIISLYIMNKQIQILARTSGGITAGDGFSFNFTYVTNE